MKLRTAISIAAVVLGILIYAGGLILAFTFGFAPFLLLAFLPLIGQLYLFLLVWQVSASFVNLYSIALFIFGCLLAVLAILTKEPDGWRRP